MMSVAGQLLKIKVSIIVGPVLFLNMTVAFAQNVILNQPYCKMDDSTWEVPSGYYYGQKIYFDISNNGMPDFSNVLWNLFYAIAETEEALDTAQWKGWAMANHIPLPLSSERMLFEFPIKATNQIFGKFKASVYTISKMEITESNIIKEKCHRPHYFADLRVKPATQLAQGQILTLSWIYEQCEGTDDQQTEIYYALSTQKTRSDSMSGWKLLSGNIVPSLQIYKKVLVDCTNSDEFYNRYIAFKIKKTPGSEVFSKAPVFITGERMSLPVIAQCSASRISPTEVRLDYIIIDPDNDLKAPVVTVTCEEDDFCNTTVVETKPSYAIISSCRGRNLIITLTAEDRQCQSTTVIRKISTAPKITDSDGYEWITGHRQDDLIKKQHAVHEYKTGKM